VVHRLAFSLLVGISAPSAAQQAQAPPGAAADTIVLSLPTLVATALRKNIDLRLAELGPRFATADLLAARAGFDPAFTLATLRGTQRGTQANEVLGISPNATQTSGANTATLGTLLPVGSQLALSLSNSSVSSDPFAATAVQPFPTSHGSGLSLSFSQPLLRGFGRAGTYGLVDAASVSVESARLRYARGADSVVALVERAYWTLRQAESDELVTRESVAASRAIYDRNVALQARDVATALDVLTSERSLATRETQLWEATRQRVDAAERLLFLVYGEDARDSTLLQAPRVHTAPDSAVVPVVPTLEAAETMAFAQRADAAAAGRDVEAGRRRVEQSRSQRRPQLDFVASYGLGGTSPTTRFLSFADSADLRSSSWTLGFNASFFWRNDGATAVDERAQSALQSARLAQMATLNAVRAEVRSALRALQTGKDRYLRAGDVARLGEREYAAAREGARLGLVTTFQLLQYEDQLAQARLLVSQARFALEDAGTQYRLAVGDGRTGYAPAGARVGK
jgi:outer membrane protein TolC